MTDLAIPNSAACPGYSCLILLKSTLVESTFLIYQGKGQGWGVDVQSPSTNCKKIWKAFFYLASLSWHEAGFSISLPGDLRVNEVLDKCNSQQVHLSVSLSLCLHYVLLLWIIPHEGRNIPLSPLSSSSYLFISRLHLWLWAGKELTEKALWVQTCLPKQNTGTLSSFLFVNLN